MMCARKEKNIAMITKQEELYLSQHTGITGFSELDIFSEVQESVFYETGEELPYSQIDKEYAKRGVIKKRKGNGLVVYLDQDDIEAEKRCKREEYLEKAREYIKKAVALW
jgi:hypothetical protein